MDNNFFENYDENKYGSANSSGSPVSKKSIPALILGIVSLVVGISGCASPIGLISGIISIILSIQAKNENDDDKKAKAGFILGIIGSIISVIALIIFIVTIVTGFFAGNY